jgi:hypothetical protein
MFQTKFVEKSKCTFYIKNVFSFENRAVCETVWKNIVEPDRPQMETWRMRIAFWITKAKDTSSEYVIVIGFLMVPRKRLSVMFIRTLAFLFGLS